MDRLNPRFFLFVFIAFALIFAFQPAQTLAQAPSPVTSFIHGEGLVANESVTAASADFSGCGGQIVAPSNAEFEQQVIELTNAIRVANGLAPLKINADLMNAARYHTADMEHDDYFKHRTYDRVNGELVEICEWFERLNSFLPNSTSSAENIAAGYLSPQAVLDGWMESSGHRESILNPSYREIGAGFAANYWSQDFAVQSGVFPAILNNEAATTESTQVTLFVHGGWSEMRIRNTGGGDSGAWSDWQPFASPTTWVLANQPGVQTVEVEMRREGFSASSIDSIELLGSTIELPPLPTSTPAPTATPTAQPTDQPTVPPSEQPTNQPTNQPTDQPGEQPTDTPPTATPAPSDTPGSIATSTPTDAAPLPIITSTPLPSATAAPPEPTSTPPVIDDSGGNSAPQVDLTGQIQLQNRPATADASWSVPLLVELYDAQTGLLTQGYTPQTTDTGAFELKGVRLGHYRLAVQTARTLKRVVDLNVTASQSVTIEPLIAGDAVDDELINIRDFSRLASAYASCADAENSFLLADFDGSGCVDDADIRLLQQNFGRVGDAILPSDKTEVALVVSSEETLRQGSRIEVDLQMHSEQPLTMDGVALYLNFDPAQMQAVAVSGNEALDVQLRNQFDNAEGRADYVAGTLNGPIDTAGQPLSLATVTFELQTDIELGTLILNTSDIVRTSDIVYGGDSQINGDWQTHAIVPNVRVVPNPESPLPPTQPPSALPSGIYLPLVTAP